jgi:hypothetical protein
VNNACFHLQMELKQYIFHLHKELTLREDSTILLLLYFIDDRLCGPVIRVPVYRSRGPGPIPDTTRFSEK